MILKLVRDTFTDTTTSGTLHIDGKFVCYTLEDVDRKLYDTMSEEEILSQKIKHRTAIPYGTYRIIVNMSNRFKRLMPLLLNVKGFDGIRIHAGNTDKNTSGCPLVGKHRSENYVYESRIAFADVFAYIHKAYRDGEDITITVTHL
jgi:hypothetical protein